MKGYISNIEQETLANENFRKVVYTAPHSQLVLMSLLPNEEIGEEVHEAVDQFFRIEKGEGKVVIDRVETPISDGSAIVVPAGARHNVINTSADKSLKLYTIYSPANHLDGIIHATKAQAEADEKSGTDHFAGKTSE
jgi:mannose-6-phosphate isomerase-like protein (cupin superfamily)